MPACGSKVVTYGCGGTYGRLIMGAFAEGCGGKYVDSAYPKYTPGIAVVWGLLRGSVRIIEEAESRGDPWYYVDHGYIGRGHTFGYYRITLRGYQKTVIEDRPSDRWGKLDMKLLPFKKGRDVLMVPPTPTVQGVMGPYWPPKIETARNVCESKKDGRPWYEKHKNIHMVVTYNSIAAIEAIIRGVPVMTTGQSAVEMFSSPSVEEPVCPENRQEWANSLAYGQFTIDEMRSGKAWGVLSAA